RASLLAQPPLSSKPPHEGRARPVPGGGGRRRSPRRSRSTVPREFGEIDTGRMPAGGQLKHHSGGSGNSEGGRQGGVGGKPASGKTTVNDPLTQPGVGGGKPPSAYQRPRGDGSHSTQPAPTDSAEDP